MSEETSIIVKKLQVIYVSLANFAIKEIFIKIKNKNLVIHIYYYSYY